MASSSDSPTLTRPASGRGPRRDMLSSNDIFGTSSPAGGSPKDSQLGRPPSRTYRTNESTMDRAWTSQDAKEKNLLDKKRAAHESVQKAIQCPDDPNVKANKQQEMKEGLAAQVREREEDRARKVADEKDRAVKDMTAKFSDASLKADMDRRNAARREQAQLNAEENKRMAAEKAAIKAGRGR